MQSLNESKDDAIAWNYESRVQVNKYCISIPSGVHDVQRKIRATTPIIRLTIIERARFERNSYSIRDRLHFTDKK
jgi:hypothetical protein